MDDLQKMLNLRRKGISGANDKKTAAPAEDAEWD